MVAMEMERTKNELRFGLATASTLASLKSLLGSNDTDATKIVKFLSKERRNTRQIKSTPSAGRNAAVSTTNRTKQVAILEDGKLCLTDREKYALATETINTCLKQLTDSLKPSNGSEATEVVLTKDERPSSTAHALQPTSGNSTPVQRSAKKPVASGKPTSANLSASETHAENLAECARLAFNFLRNADPVKSGVREIPRLQLETGVLALVGKMISHGLHHMAVQELRLFKTRHEAAMTPKPAVQTAKSRSADQSDSKEKETFASLLDIRVGSASSLDSLQNAITHQQHVMKIITTARKPAVIQEALQYLHIERPNSPSSLISQQMKVDPKISKCAKQLDALSHSILGLCPSVSSAADVLAKDAQRSPSPAVVLELQVIALRIRQAWWKMAAHQADVAKELLHPFLKCATAYHRRCLSNSKERHVYDHLTAAYNALGPFELVSTSSLLFDFYDILILQAEQAKLFQEALRWADKMIEQCSYLDSNHARKLAAISRKAAIVLQQGSSAEYVETGQIGDCLDRNLTGNSPDYDILLAALSNIAQAIHATSSNDAHGSPRLLLVPRMAGFALRYARSYPGKNMHHLQIIMDVAMRMSKSTEDLLTWVTDEAARLFVQAGTLRRVADVAGSRSLKEAWLASSSSVSLSRIIRALVLRSVRNIPDSQSMVFDDDQLPSAERGALLEWQLIYAVDLASKSKYHNALRSLLPELLKRLSKLYPVKDFPLRRARVAAMAFRLRECYAELLPPHNFKIWHDQLDIHEASLERDCGLLKYCQDIQAKLAISKALTDGHPTSADLEPALVVWEQVIDTADSKQILHDVIDEPDILVVQLDSLVSYFNMLGDHTAALRTQRLRTAATSLLNVSPSDTCAALLNLAGTYLEMGYCGKAGHILEQAQVHLESEETTTLIRLQFHLMYAEYLLAIDNTGNCRASLEEARSLRLAYPPEKVHKQDRRQYELLHARAWLTQSKTSTQLGLPPEALTAAKRSVRVLNSIWSGLEHSQPNSGVSTKINMESDTSEDSRMSSLTRGVSKLQLQPAGGKAASGKAAKTDKGAIFWDISPPLCKALLHLSDMYVHHGLFSEANYYSERAIDVAQSVGSSVLLSRIRSHRCQLLALAGRLEEAELCLTKDEVFHDVHAPLVSIERYIAEAAIREQEGSFQEAKSLYDTALEVVDQLSQDGTLSRLEKFRNLRTSSQAVVSKTIETHATDNQLSASKAQRVSKVGRPKQALRQTASKVTSAPSRKLGTPGAGDDQNSNVSSASRNYLLGRLKATMTVSRACIASKLGEDAQQTLAVVGTLSESLPQRYNAQYNGLMQVALAALAKDVTLNIVAESTLSLPAVKNVGYGVEKEQSVKQSKPKAKAVAKKVKPTKQTRTDPDVRVEDLLLAARDSLLNGRSVDSRLQGTIHTHAYCASLLNVTMFVSAVSQSEKSWMCSAEGSHAIDLPRIKALQSEQSATAVDVSSEHEHESLSWPNIDIAPQSCEVQSAKDFQNQFINIIPNTWTAVSLSLSEDATELYVARYHADQSPLILRLPFARHKLDDLEDEAFDYRKGKAELQDIIKLSNYTCHNTSGLEAKGAKTNWWSEREALDKRLHELLINIENIWLGGFKGMLSSRKRNVDLLLRFRKSFEAALDRYLPSRKVSRGKTVNLQLDDNVLDLFVGLGQDHNGTEDLEQPLSDLLYFIVDMLQFGGERNAYDEIDFDSMAVDVLDALQAYHDAYSALQTDAQHLILVLDRRLHNFPWESLPCLEGVSVSRVGSMLCLRERINAMRSSNQTSDSTGLSGDRGDRHLVQRTWGTYILNPSSDLRGTEKSLGPSLASLTTKDTMQWTAIVNEAPSEARFRSALTDTSILLYFGHGAGSQYIRPRSVRRLNQCSDVVWLMGCSSGAVSEYGDLESSAVPLSYLLAGQHGAGGPERDNDLDHDRGCFAALVNLWDVTDKDVDRFSLSTGEVWGLWPSSQQANPPTKTPRKREIVPQPSTPQQVPKTPKTPKVLKTPAPAKTPGRSWSRVERRDGKKATLNEAVAQSRDACYLRYLNGAAPVVYGIPVLLAE